MRMSDTAVFGGGCFWCTEAVFKMMRGVSSVIPGYAGGNLSDGERPTYKQVSAGNTGYAECVKIVYDPKLIEYTDLLTVFFGSHDPTTLNRQGADVGTQYRSVIFYTTAEQKQAAESYIASINASNEKGAPVVTDLEPLTDFYEAEDYHHDYFAKNRGNPYCDIVINPKLEKVQESYAHLLQDLHKNDMDGRKPMPQSEEEWKDVLTPEQYRVLREKGTEAPFSGKLSQAGEDGAYRCAACGNPLFASDAKFESGTGWPSFDRALPGAVKEIEDTSSGMARTEIVCSNCGSHLGHVFDDGPTATGKRYCTNSVCLT